MDSITLNELPLHTVIGTLPQERLRPQLLTADVEIFLDLHPAGVSDDLFKSVDYSEIERRLTELAEQSKFLLLEALGEAMGKLLLEYPLVRKARVRLTKPLGARQARSISVEMNFSR